jgi:hypothetical protein
MTKPLGCLKSEGVDGWEPCQKERRRIVKVGIGVTGIHRRISALSRREGYVCTNIF